MGEAPGVRGQGSEVRLDWDALRERAQFLAGVPRDEIHRQINLGLMVLELQEQTGEKLPAVTRKLCIHYKTAWRAVKVAEAMAPEGFVDDEKIDELIRSAGFADPRKVTKRQVECAVGARA